MLNFGNYIIFLQIVNFLASLKRRAQPSDVAAGGDCGATAPASVAEGRKRERQN